MFEHEWLRLRPILAWAQRTRRPFDFWFNSLDEATKYVVTLIHPRQGEPIRPMRQTSYRPLFIQELTIRSVGGVPFYQNLFRARGIVDTVDATPPASTLNLTIGTVQVTPETADLEF
jgi:hypothetical protein